VPQHVVHEQDAASAQAPLDDRQRVGIAGLVDVVEDEVERTLGGLKGGDRLS
jgi:hypothetical protein